MLWIIAKAGVVRAKVDPFPIIHMSHIAHTFKIHIGESSTLMTQWSKLMLMSKQNWYENMSIFPLVWKFLDENGMKQKYQK